MKTMEAFITALATAFTDACKNYYEPPFGKGPGWSPGIVIHFRAETSDLQFAYCVDVTACNPLETVVIYDLATPDVPTLDPSRRFPVLWAACQSESAFYDIAHIAQIEAKGHVRAVLLHLGEIAGNPATADCIASACRNIALNLSADENQLPSSAPWTLVVALLASAAALT